MATSTILALHSDTGWISLNNNIAYRKISKKYVCVRGTALTTEQNKWTNVGTLPSGYRPTNATVYTAGGCGSYSKTFMAVRIDTTGDIRTSSDITATSGYFDTMFAL